MSTAVDNHPLYWRGHITLRYRQMNESLQIRRWLDACASTYNVRGSAQRASLAYPNALAAVAAEKSHAARKPSSRAFTAGHSLSTMLYITESRM